MTIPKSADNVSALSDKKIIKSWFKNAKPWIAAIDNNQIASRVEVTNRAILAVIDNQIHQKKQLQQRNSVFEPIKVLDIGCGEGWLIRALDNNVHTSAADIAAIDVPAIDVLGIDGVQELIDTATVKTSKSGVGRFKTVSYEQLSFALLQETFDLIVCNFSLLGQQSVTRIFEQLPNLLNENGVFIVQTIHPVAGCGEHDYLDGWRVGSWQGFNEDFIDPPPWYFRTMASWMRLFREVGFNSPEIIEPKSKTNNTPLSVIFVAEYA